MIRPKKCRICHQPYTPIRPLQTVCSYGCALIDAQKESAKLWKHQRALERKARKEAKERLKTRRDWIKEVQSAVNRFVRLRDADKPCISCGTWKAAQWDAGHYMSAGGHPALRFEPLNIHKQCSVCNAHKSGNLVMYRAGLIEREGIKTVEWLEGPHDPAKWTIDDLKAKKTEFSRMARELLREREAA
ncbi:MAG: recombination protein NinG [Pseudomonadota bacterium]|nr:recombination protein NinG [Pseudomonadota bacterium]